MEMYIPEEIWRHILSYLALPYTSLVCRFLHGLEKDLDEERYENCTTMYDCIDDAVWHRHWDIVLYLLHKKHHINDHYMVSTIIGQHGHRAMVQSLVDHNRAYNFIACGAAKAGHKDIVVWMIDLGANVYSAIAYNASIGHNNTIAKWVLEKGGDKKKYMHHGAEWCYIQELLCSVEDNISE